MVATRHAGIKDVAIEGTTGFLCDEADVAAMSANMLRLAQDPELAASMGRAARKHIQKNYTTEQSISGLDKILRDVQA